MKFRMSLFEMTEFALRDVLSNGLSSINTKKRNKVLTFPKEPLLRLVALPRYR